MAATSEPNPRIGRDAHPSESFRRYVMCLNIANAKRDDEHNPLCDRIADICGHINRAPTPIDALILLEAGRPSRGISWTSMAASIENFTGLHYVGVRMLNATENPFGKALFIRRSTLALSGMAQRWISQQEHHWDGPHFGLDYLEMIFHPVVQEHAVIVSGRDPELLTRVIRDRSVSFAAFHFPMDRASRMKAADYINQDQCSDVLVGDFNTFPDDGGPEMIKVITSSCYRRKKMPAPYTFKAFEHDLVRKPADFRSQVNEHSEIVQENDDGTLSIRFASTLDHIFYYDDNSDTKVGQGSYVLPMEGASDHEGMVVEVIY